MYFKQNYNCQIYLEVIFQETKSDCLCYSNFISSHYMQWTRRVEFASQKLQLTISCASRRTSAKITFLATGQTEDNKEVRDTQFQEISSSVFSMNENRILHKAVDTALQSLVQMLAQLEW